MNRIKKLFEDKKERVLSVFYTAGYPDLNDTVRVLETLEKSGADLVEIGMPFSDPVADGPTIQASNDKALANGISLKKIFEQLEGVRSKVQLPVIMMGYLNPVMQYGLENFCKKCAEIGIDGLILPDLPLNEYIEEYKGMFEKYGLLYISLITPQTSEARIRMIDENSEGFIYMVSSASVTGAKTGISADQEAYFNRVNNMGLKNPRLIGFGISNKATFDSACKYASGAIIGSAMINTLANAKNIEKDVVSFVSTIVN